MTTANQAADFIRKQAKLYEGFVLAAAELERIGSMELAAKEALQAKEKAEAERFQADIDLAAISKDIVAAKAKAKLIVSQADTEAQAIAADIVEVASQKAADIVIKAENVATDIQVRCTELAQATSQKIEEGKNELELVLQDLDSARTDLLATNAELSNLREALAALKARIAA